MLISATCKEIVLSPNVRSLPHGITAEAIVAVNIANEGPKINNNLLAFAGRISSLVNNFTPSAKGCNNPKGPARLGPKRSWKNAAKRRSTKVMYMATTKLTSNTMVIKLNFSIIIANSIFLSLFSSYRNDRYYR
ncbi:hypothetical protein D3C78_1166690 [compost metagenome]